MLAFIPSAGKWEVFFKFLTWFLRRCLVWHLEQLDGSTVSCRRWSALCMLALEFNLNSTSDSLSALLLVRSPTHFLSCVFFSSLTCSLTCFLIHLQAESLLYLHKSDFCRSFSPPFVRVMVTVVEQGSEGCFLCCSISTSPSTSWIHYWSFKQQSQSRGNTHSLVRRCIWYSFTIQTLLSKQINTSQRA